MAFALIIKPKGSKPASWQLILSGLLVCFSFLSKQDFGLLALAGTGAYVLFFYEQGKLSFKPGLWLGLGFGLGIATMVVPFLAHDFGYWFNFGQPPHQSRLNDTHRLIWSFIDLSHSQETIVSTVAVFIVHIFAYQAKWYKNLDFRYLGFVMFMYVQSVATYLTSGLFQSHDYSLAFLLVGFASVVFSAIEHKKLLPILKLSALGFFFYVQVNPFFDEVIYGFDWDSYRFIHNSPLRVSNHKGYNNLLISEAALNGAVGFDAYLDSKLTEGKEYKILNTSEFTPSVQKKGLIQPTGYPLWFDSANSFFPRERQKCYADLKSHQFDLLFIQATHSPHPVGFIDSVNKYYYKTAAFFTPCGYDSVRVYEPKP
jgi:hypothetical protein